MRYETFIGLRYLKARTGLLFSIGGVAVGIATVVVALSVMNGWESMIRDKMLNSEGHIFVRGNLNNYRTMMQEIEEVDGVDAAAPLVVKRVAILDKNIDQQAGAMLKAIDPEQQTRVTDIADYVPGELSFESPLIKLAASKTEDTIFGGIILGENLARNLMVSEGDIVRIISKMVNVPGVGLQPVVRTFVVVNIYDSGMYSYDSVLAFISLEAGQKMYGLTDTVDRIEVKINDIHKADGIRDEIQKKLGFVDVMTWMEAHETLFEAIKLEKLVTFIIEALIIFVATFNIASTLIMMVMAKTKEIGIIKSMGATKRNIWLIFTFEGTLIGVAGAILGTLLGVFLCWSLQTWLPIPIPSTVYQINRLPAEISWPFVALVDVASLGLCWLATLYPAWRASRLRPVEALRYE
ncbi:FtsX-like permease family protein [Candidatus Poribacteria bacterium]